MSFVGKDRHFRLLGWLVMSPRRPLQGIVKFTDHFSRLPVLAIVACVLLAAIVVAWSWGSIWVGFGFGLLGLGDGVMLALLPRFKRSYGPPQLPLLSLTVLRLTLALIATLGPRAWALLIVGLVQLGSYGWLKITSL